MSNPSCEDRINAHLALLLKSIKKYNEVISEGLCADRFFTEELDNG